MSTSSSIPQHKLQISFTSRNFAPKWGITLGTDRCLCTWAELIRSATSVGKLKGDLRPYGIYSKYEAVYRAHIIRANLKRAASGHLLQSDPFKVLDPSEKGAISYFMGLSMAKLFAERYLDVPWLMHLDVYKSQLTPQLARGRAKPDLVGENSAGDWVVIEAKGRTHKIERGLMDKAKGQAKRLKKVKGVPVTLKVALASHFDGESLCVDWRDPEGEEEAAYDLDLSHDAFIQDYYEPFLSILNAGEYIQREAALESFRVVRLFDNDLTIGLSEEVLRYLEARLYKQLFEYTSQRSAHADNNVSVGKDGVFVELSENWIREAESPDKDEEHHMLEEVRRDIIERQRRHTP